MCSYILACQQLLQVQVWGFGLTSQSAVKVPVCGHVEARMWQQEAADVREAGMDVLPHILQLFMLFLSNLQLIKQLQV